MLRTLTLNGLVVRSPLALSASQTDVLAELRSVRRRRSPPNGAGRSCNATAAVMWKAACTSSPAAGRDQGLHRGRIPHVRRGDRLLRIRGDHDSPAGVSRYLFASSSRPRIWLALVEATVDGRDRHRGRDQVPLFYHYDPETGPRVGD